METWDEKAVLRDAIAAFRQAAKPIDAITRIKPADPDALVKLEKALERLPSGADLAQTLDDLKGRTVALIQEAKRVRVERFGYIEAAYRDRAVSDGKEVREWTDGWRIDKLRLELRRAQAQARFLYTEYPILNWSTVCDLEDLMKLEHKALSDMALSEIEDEVLIHCFWQAFEAERKKRHDQGLPNPSLVPILDFYRRVRVELVAHELEKRPDKRLAFVDMPRWAFVYNLDRYLAMWRKVPSDMRVAVQTGAQAETKNGLVVNGLRASDHFRVMCYVVQAQG